MKLSVSSEQSMARLERRLRRHDSYFLRFASDERSQGGEDGILRELFRLLGPEQRYCVDVGAWDGQWLSNSYALLHGEQNQSVWNGLLVEANPHRLEEAKKLYRNNPRVVCECSLVGFEGPSSLLSILSRHYVPHSFDFLSIDVDGADYHLWESLRLSSYRPKIVCIEFNPSIPNDVYFIQERNIHIQQGSSLLAISELAQSMEYTLLVTTTFNAIFIANEFKHLMPIFDNAIDTLHVPTMSTEMFQTYDGELKYIGCMKLLWHKIPMNPDKLQLLKRKDRKYPFSPHSPLSLTSIKKNITRLRNINIFTDLEIFGSLSIQTLTELKSLSHLPYLRDMLIEQTHLLLHVVELALQSIKNAAIDVQLACSQIGWRIMLYAFNIMYERAIALIDGDILGSEEMMKHSLCIATWASQLPLLKMIPTSHNHRLDCMMELSRITRRRGDLLQSRYWLLTLKEAFEVACLSDNCVKAEIESFLTKENVNISSRLLKHDTEEIFMPSEMGDSLMKNIPLTDDARLSNGDSAGLNSVIQKLESERNEAHALLKAVVVICIGSIAISVSLLLRFRKVLR